MEMRRSNVFWPVVLILLGVILLLQNLGILSVNVWGLIWPLLLIVLGIWFLTGASMRRRTFEVEQAAITLEGAGRALVHVRHGAGRLRVDSTAGPGQLVSGSFSGGLDSRSRHDGDALDVTLRVPEQKVGQFFWPGFGGARGTLDWTFGLNKEVPLALDFETGASDTRLDLTDLQVTDLQLKTGASASEVFLPAYAKMTTVKIGSGAAAVSVHVPPGVAARIHVKSGLASIDVDPRRFPRDGEWYVSPDYGTAQNRAQIDVETGVGAVSIR